MYNFRIDTRHGEDAHEEADVAAGQHHFLFRFRPVAFLLGRPYAHDEDQQVEDHNGHDTSDVDHFHGFLLTRFLFTSYNTKQIYDVLYNQVALMTGLYNCFSKHENKRQ